jgi:hypothetical protein
MKLDEAMLLLEGLSAREIRDFMRARLPPTDADNYDMVIKNLSRDVLVLVSARALTRLAAHPPVRRSGASASPTRVSLRAPLGGGRE